MDMVGFLSAGRYFVSERSFICDVHLISGVKKKQATVSQEEASPWSEDSRASHASAERPVAFPNNPVPQLVNAMTGRGSLHSWGHLLVGLPAPQSVRLLAQGG
jgi:hypothetical protein